jgi:hypothetical protein
MAVNVHINRLVVECEVRPAELECLRTDLEVELARRLAGPAGGDRSGRRGKTRARRIAGASTADVGSGLARAIAGTVHAAVDGAR